MGPEVQSQLLALRPGQVREQGSHQMTDCGCLPSHRHRWLPDPRRRVLGVRLRVLVRRTHRQLLEPGRALRSSLERRDRLLVLDLRA